MRKKTIFILAIIIALLTVSCGGKEHPVTTEKSVYKIEISTTENSMHYKEVLVLQINDNNASSVNIKNAPDFEVEHELSSPFSKMFKSIKKAQRLSVFETSQPVGGITLALGYSFDDETTSENDFSFMCTIKVNKDNKLFDTNNYNFNKASIESIVLVYNNDESLRN